MCDACAPCLRPSPDAAVGFASSRGPARSVWPLAGAFTIFDSRGFRRCLRGRGGSGGPADSLSELFKVTSRDDARAIVRRVVARSPLRLLIHDKLVSLRRRRKKALSLALIDFIYLHFFQNVLVRLRYFASDFHIM